MSLKDKVTGRLKQAAGDLTGDERLRREGADEERKADAEQELREAEQAAARKREEVARLEYQTASPSARQDASNDRADDGRQGDADSESGLAGSDPRRDEHAEHGTHRIEQR